MKYSEKSKINNEIGLLRNLAIIGSGHLFRYKPDYVESGGYPVVQMKDVLPGETVNWKELGRVRVKGVKESSFIRQGDVLLKSKGVSHIGATADEPLEDTIASSHIIIIRPQTDVILPEYLTWYINQNPAQQRMNSLSAGSNVKHLSMKRVGELPIPVPDMETQKKIAELYWLRQREKNLTELIQKKRQQLINAVLLNKIGSS